MKPQVPSKFYFKLSPEILEKNDDPNDVFVGFILVNATCVYYIENDEVTASRGTYTASHVKSLVDGGLWVLVDETDEHVDQRLKDMQASAL